MPQEFFVFNRDFLYADLDSLTDELAEELPLQPAMPGALRCAQSASTRLIWLLAELDLAHPPTPRSLVALLAWSSHLLDVLREHTSSARELHAHLTVIQRSTTVALLNLVSHSAAVRASFAALEELAERELGRMRGLLDGHERDLKALSLVNINPRLLTSAEASKAGVGSGKPPPKERMLGHYVHASKMGAVFDACSKVQQEMQQRLEEIRGSAAQLAGDTEGLRAEVEGTRVDPSTDTLDEAEQALARAETLDQYLVSTCSPDENGWPAADALGADDEELAQVERSAEELLLLDEVGRDDMRRLNADKNDMMSRALHLLGDISSLQSDYADLGASIAALDADLRSSKIDGFRHLARLKNMIWAYGATVVEVVRRREFARHFMNKAQALAELMAKISAAERRRRDEYRTEVLGQLPWEVKGLDEAPLSLEISTSKAPSGVAEIEREDVDAFFSLLDEIDRALSGPGTDSPGGPLQEVKAALQQLMLRLDEVDDDFAQLVDIGLLGRGRSSEEEDSEENSDIDGPGPRRIAGRRRDLNHQAKQAVAEAVAKAERIDQELQTVRRDAEEREQRTAETHDAELAALRAEAAGLRTEARMKAAELDTVRLERQASARAIESLRADAETEAARRLNMEEELGRLRLDAELARRAEAEARAEATEESERVAELEAHLGDAQLELEEAKAARLDASNRIESLLGQGTSTERELSAAQEHINDLVAQLAAARAETRETRDLLTEAESARDKALRTYRAEVDGDRAILEETIRRKDAELHRAAKTSEQAQTEAAVQREAADTLRGQLRAADEAHEEMIRQATDAEVSRRHAERTLDNIVGRTRPLLAKTTQLRRFVRAMPALSSSSKSGAAAKAAAAVTVDEADSAQEEAAEAQRQAALDAFEADVSGASPEVVLEALRALDGGASHPFAHDEARTKLESLTTLVRKWQKAYRSSSDKLARATAAARERITFRNFAAGDLALFLPTRNTSTSARPWAAFNISFPHFFLNARGALANQLRTKEWIVARITRIEERIATNEGEDGNPFQLAEGVRYYLLDVDGWNNPSSSALANAASSASTAMSQLRRSTSVSVGDGPSSSGPEASLVPQSPVPDAAQTGSAPELRRAGSFPQASPPLMLRSSGTSVPVSERATMASKGRRQTSEGNRLPTSARIDEEVAPPPMSPEISPPDAPSRKNSSDLSATVVGAVQPLPKRNGSGPAVTLAGLSRATSPSGISRAFRGSGSRGTSPEQSRYAPGASGRPWPMPSSLGNEPRGPGVLETAAPAFGQGKRRAAAADAAGSTSVPSSVGASAVASSSTSPSKPIFMRSNQALTPASALNPFSQSPAPGSVQGEAGGASDYFSRRRRVSLLGPSREGSSSTPSDAAAGERPLDSSTSAASPRPVPGSVSSRSNRISINGNSLMLSHVGASSSNLLSSSAATSSGAGAAKLSRTPTQSSPALATADLTPALGETSLAARSPSADDKAASVGGASSVSGGAGSSAFSTRTGPGTSPLRSATLGRSTIRPSVSTALSDPVGTPPRFGLTWGRKAAATSIRRRDTSDAGASESFVGSEGSQASSASVALRRLATARRDAA
jgi:hypothetical protein